jgi:hypothetical protein
VYEIHVAYIEASLNISTGQGTGASLCTNKIELM